MKPQKSMPEIRIGKEITKPRKVNTFLIGQFTVNSDFYSAFSPGRAAAGTLHLGAEKDISQLFRIPETLSGAASGTQSLSNHHGRPMASNETLQNVQKLSISKLS
jgi:hypothetical protein